MAPINDRRAGDASVDGAGGTMRARLPPYLLKIVGLCVGRLCGGPLWTPAADGRERGAADWSMVS